ncbi:MAG: LTA synthase family protein [Bacteroidales bacterium]|jgi:phosphoglycerol transferase MdoB-like AlkP superfamily enzyme|nr:LTA synthase family protein [Bacteroidales bacterium]
MLCHCFKEANFSDYFEVIWHGLSLDITTSAYLSAVPLLIIIIAVWIKIFNVKKILKIYCIILSVFIALLFAIDNTLYSYWDFRLDATAIFYLQFPKDAASSITWTDVGRTLIVFIPYLTVIIFIYMLLLQKIKIVFTPKQYLKKGLETFIFILLMPVLFIAIRGGITTATANVGMVYYSNNQKLNHSAINPLFNVMYSLINDENFDKEFNFFTEKQRAEIFTSTTQYQHSAHPLYVLNTKTPNILIIVLESFTANVVECVGGKSVYDQKDITPNLNNLSREGILFTNCYANSFRTDRGLVSILNGYLGLPTTSIMKYPAKSQTLPSIAKTLKEKGYTNSILYGGDINFTNMQGYFYSSGYETIISDKDFPLNNKLSKWGVNDGLTFNRLYNDLLKMDKNKHWQTTFLTLSSHEPFDVPYKHFTDPFENSIAYTDSCIGNFINKLKKTDLWENLLVIFVADHGVIYPKNIIAHSPLRFHIPMIWAGGTIKQPLLVKNICNQSDIAATLLSQLGLSYTEFIFSKDIFDNNSPEYAIYTYNNGFGFIDSTGFSVYDNNQNKSLINHDSTLIKKGKAILQTLYDDLSKR